MGQAIERDAESGSGSPLGLELAWSADTACLSSVRRRNRVRYARCKPCARASPQSGPLSSVSSCRCSIQLSSVKRPSCVADKRYQCRPASLHGGSRNAEHSLR